MMKEESSDGGGGGGGPSNSWARVCDTCRSAACTVYCKADMAYLCGSCDAKIHAANRVASRHERVFVCEACERAPAAFLCKADAASLCAACDADIHSANPLARRHQRVPILPISGSVYGPSGVAEEGFMGPEGGENEDDDDEEEAASWLLINPTKNNNNNNNTNFLFGGEVDEYLDLVDYNGENQYVDHYNHHHHHHQQQQQQQFSYVPQKNHMSDSIVPVQYQFKDQQNQQSFQLGLEYESSKAGYSSYNGSISHSVSVSSTDVGVVPESTMSDISMSHSRPPKGTIDLFSGPPIQMPLQLTPIDREARVLRYREKKKTRKFEKTIRYASRKAYAETRPRIKGRFAKRTDVEIEVDQMFSTTLITDTGYGIVPSF